METQKRNVLVTGASQGLGATIAARFARGGHRVWVNCAHGVEKAGEVVAGIVRAGGEAETFPCDLTDEGAVEEAFAALEARAGGIDILVNNARLDPYLRGAADSDGAWFDRTLAVNLRGAYLATLAVFDGMKSRGWGRVVNVSSIWAQWSAPRNLIPYSVSKAGMHALTRAFAREGAPHQVTVNTVAPGLILTENAASRLGPEKLLAETASVPLGRGAAPEEIAEIIWNTVHSGFITGQTIHANGGAWMGN
ncbi:MAG: SDR family oxidoreductase [Spirochaetes bacterium]|nr:SDR family oxidoreductase [Spirochaetota bacterium]